MTTEVLESIKYEQDRVPRRLLWFGKNARNIVQNSAIDIKKSLKKKSLKKKKVYQASDKIMIQLKLKPAHTHLWYCEFYLYYPSELSGCPCSAFFPPSQRLEIFKEF